MCAACWRGCSLWHRRPCLGLSAVLAQVPHVYTCRARHCSWPSRYAHDVSGPAQQTTPDSAFVAMRRECTWQPPRRAASSLCLTQQLQAQSKWPAMQPGLCGGRLASCPEPCSTPLLQARLPAGARPRSPWTQTSRRPSGGGSARPACPRALTLPTRGPCRTRSAGCPSGSAQASSASAYDAGTGCALPTRQHGPD